MTTATRKKPTSAVAKTDGAKPVSQSTPKRPWTPLSRKKSDDPENNSTIKNSTMQLVHDENDQHRPYGGTASPAFNQAMIGQVIRSVWLGTEPLPIEQQEFFQCGPIGALWDIAPKDAVEGMLAAQMVATHNAAMECFRRAMLPEQPHAGREMNLSQANRLTRSYTTLVAALDKHRGKGQQTVRVEHVHVHSGGQAIVGNVSHDGHQKIEEDAATALLSRGSGEKDVG